MCAHSAQLGLEYGEKKLSKRYVLDYLGVVLYVLSILWLGFAIVTLRDPDTQLQLFRLIVFLLLGTGAFLFGLRVSMRFTMRDVVKIVVIGFPIYVLAFLAVIGASSPTVPSAVTFVYYICVGTAEEMFFRGLIFLLSARLLSVWGGRGRVMNCVLNGFLFGVYHAYAYGGDLGAMMFAMVAGAFFAAAFDMTGHLSYPMVMHIIYNLSVAVATGHRPLG